MILTRFALYISNDMVICLVVSNEQLINFYLMEVIQV